MKDRYDKAKDIAQVISLVAIPVVLAICGWMIQSSINDREIRRDYVQLALQIMGTENSSESEELRRWAKRVLIVNSPVPFTEEQISALDTRLVYVPPPAIPDLPSIARVSRIPVPPVCSPSCLDGLARWRESAVEALSDDPTGDTHAN